MKGELKVNDFFCGCGGMGTAFKNAGFVIAGAWDFDKYAVQTYRENVGGHVRQQDIRELTYKDIPRADVWAFGFPCQDLSVAGKQRGMVMKCGVCGEELHIRPEEGRNNAVCPNCGSSRLRAESRSGCFFEIMRLLDETVQNVPGNMPAVIIAENVKGLKPYLPVLDTEYARHGYTAHVQMFNSKYWGVPQNRERYAVVGTRDCLGMEFAFPEEQHEFVPKLSDCLEKDVPEKYFIRGEKAENIIAQAAEKIKLETCHACITPDRVNKRQNGPRAKAAEEPMFTLTAQDLHGVILNVTESGQMPLNVYNNGTKVTGIAEISQTLLARGYKGWTNKYPSIAVIENQEPAGSLQVRKLTPKEYGILQAFPMDGWVQVVSDSQAYKQFGNAVTVTLFTEIARAIGKAVSGVKAMDIEIKDLVGMLAGSDRIRIVEDGKELFTGFIANFTPYEVFGQLKDKTAKRFHPHIELRHKRWKEMGLAEPVHPEQTPDFLFSDLQMTVYYDIEI